MKLYDLLDRFFRDDPSLLYLCASEFAARNDYDNFPRKDSESESAGSCGHDESYAAPNDTGSCGDAFGVQSDDGTARSEDGIVRSDDSRARSDDGYDNETNYERGSSDDDQSDMVCSSHGDNPSEDSDDGYVSEEVSGNESDDGSC